MCKLMVVVTRFLSLCAVLLVLPAIAAAQPTPPTPGWYSNSGPNGESIIYEDSSGLRIVWGNSYIYRHPGTVNLYWYAQVIYRNMGSQTLPQTCIGRADPSLAKEHIRGTQGIPPDGDGFVAAEETFCSRNPNFTGIIEPGGALYSWAIFHNVPSGGEVFLEWSYPGNAGFSQWVDPWFSPYPSTVPRPAECPPELVTLGTCQSKVPEGTAPNLIVLVHGCCTDASGVYEWNALADTIGGEIIKKQTPWEILVWDWTQDTPTTGPDQIGKAYENAKKQSLDLSLAIAKLNHTYEYIHLIGHSSGARLIHLAAKRLANYYRTKKDKPFIHITFLDAYTPFGDGKDSFGKLASYPEHYSEHYVDRTKISLWTDTLLSQAFNFDITDWQPISHQNPDEKRDAGHQWPRHWYQKSVTTPGFAYGYQLSREWGNELFHNLITQFPVGGCISLLSKDKIGLC